MNTEEKAKAYDEALERAREWHNDSHITIGLKGNLEDIFPELKESEDERIRKEIIATIHLYYGKPLEDEAKEMIAWLEKQGEQKEKIVDFKAKDWYVSKVDGKIYNAKFMEESLTNQKRRLEIEKAAMSATGIIEQEEWFIKGAEWSDKNPSCISSEKQGEQKHTDEIEPKFHEGEWITNGDYTWKIVEVKPLDYILQSQEGNIVDDTISHVDEQFHSFTIKDAKDGDVLCVKYGNDEMPFIFTGKQDDVAYCALNSFGEFVLSIAEWLLKTSVLPATKEQRDTLMKAMADAGWEFDFEKKELKKISQRMVSAEAKEALYDKPAWSEDDEKRLQSCINILKAKSLMGKVDTANTMWLKSLKQRIGG